MRGRTLILIAAACGALAAGCAKPAPEAPAVDLAAEAQAVRDRSTAWMQLSQAKDVAGIVNGIYTADAATLYDGEIHKGVADLQADMEADNAKTPNSTTNWTTTDVQVAKSGDLAYERGSYTNDADGAGEAAAVNGEYVTIWTKADGTWRVIVDAGTLQKAPEAAPAGG